MLIWIRNWTSTLTWSYDKLSAPGNCLSTRLYDRRRLPTMVLYGLPNKNQNFLVISLIVWLCFVYFACLCVFCAVAPVVSTALHSLALVCLHLLHGTLFPWGKIKDLKVNNKFWHYFLLCNFCLLVWLVFDLCSACKLWLWCCKGCVPVRSVKTGVAATHRAALDRIGARAPTQAITAAQQAR